MLALDRRLPTAARLGRPDALRPLPAALVAGALAALVHGRRSPRLRAARRGDRGEALPGRARPARRCVCLASPRPARGARRAGRARRRRRGCLPPLPRRRPRRPRGQRRPPALPAAPDREPRLGALPRGTSPGRARRRDALRPRLSEPARDRDGGGRRPAHAGPARRARLDLARGGPASPRSSFAGARPRSSPSSRSGRCSRPSFSSGSCPPCRSSRGGAGIRASALLCARARRHAALVPVPLLGPGARARRSCRRCSCSPATSCSSRCSSCCSGHRERAPARSP